MRAQQSATATVERVLLYLERRLQVAEHFNRRWDSHAYELAWLLVFESYYGANPRPLLQVVPSPGQSRTNPDTDKPWFRDKYAKPVRRVVRNIEYSLQGYDGEPARLWFDQVLECGHRIEMQYDADERPRPRHRRCAECARDKSEASNGSVSSSANTVQRTSVLESHLPHRQLWDATAAREGIPVVCNPHSRMFAVSRGDDNAEETGRPCGPIGAD